MQITIYKDARKYTITYKADPYKMHEGAWTISNEDGQSYIEEDAVLFDAIDRMFKERYVNQGKNA